MPHPPKLIGQLLKEMSLITDAQINEALAAQRLTPAKRFAEVLIERKFVTPNQIAEALVQQWKERFASHESGSLFVQGIKRLLAKSDIIFDLQKALINVLEELEDAQEELQVIYRISSAVVQEKEFYQFLKIIAEEIRLFTRSDRATIFFRHENRLISWVAEKVGEPLKISLNEGVAGWVATHNQAYLTNDVSQDKYFQSKMDQMTGYETKNLLAVPISFGNENIGVLEIMNKEGGYSDYDLARINKISNQIGVVVKKLWLEQSVKERRKDLEESHIKTKRTVKELETSQEKLKEATAQLVQTEKLGALGELTAGVAHELNQPLNSVKIICQSLLRDVAKKRLDTESLPQDLGDVIKQIDKMAEIIDHMRVFTRRAEGTSRETFDINQPIEGIFKLLGQQLAVHNIEVIRNLSSDLPKVKGNPSQMEQVLMNLITNARAAVEEFRSKDRRVEIKTYARQKAEGKQQEVIVEVKDNGPGIPPDQQAKIFEPFFTTKRPGKGTGLGLSVSKRIIEEHQGRFELASTTGQGSTFRIVLPAVAEEPKTEIIQ